MFKPPVISTVSAMSCVEEFNRIAGCITKSVFQNMLGGLSVVLLAGLHIFFPCVE